MSAKKKQYKRPPRPGEGRPPLPDDQKRKTRMVRIPDEWADYIEEQARRRGESMGQFVEHVLRMYRGTPRIL